MTLFKMITSLQVSSLYTVTLSVSASTHELGVGETNMQSITISIKETGLIINLPKQKAHTKMGSGEFYQTYKKKFYQFLTISSRKWQKEYFPKSSITLIPN